MNWLRHELRLRAHKVGRAIHFMTASPSNHSNKREFEMKENFLVDLSKQFAVDIVNPCTDVKENRKSNVLKGVAP